MQSEATHDLPVGTVPNNIAAANAGTEPPTARQRIEPA